MASPQEDHRELVVNACEEFANSLLRSKALLKEDDYLEASEMIDIILQEVKLQENRVPPLQPPHITSIPTIFSPIDPPDSLTIEQIKKGQLPKPKKAYLPPFKASSFRKDVEQFAESAKSYTEAYNNKLVRTYLSTLPLPKWGGRDAWDEIPIKDIPSILVNFQCLLEFVARAEDTQTMLAAFTLYALADKLVRRVDAKRELEKFALPFPLEEIEQYLFFPLGAEEKRFQQIKEYFFKSKGAAKGSILPYPKKWDQISPEMQTLFYLASISVKLAKGERVYLDQLSQYRSWDELHRAESLDFNISLERRLIKFFLKYKSFTANDVLCTPKNYKPVENGKENTAAELLLNKWEQEELNKELLDELMLLLRSPKLQLGLVAQWILAHFNELNKEVVQKIIELALFSSGALKARAQEMPEAIKELQSLIEKGFIYYGVTFDNYPAILFLIRCGITLESYVAEFSNLPIDGTKLENYKTRLKVLQSLIDFEGERKDEDDYYIQILATQQFLEAFTEKRSVEHFIELYTNLFKFGTITYCAHAFGVSSSLWFRYDTYRYRYFEQLQQFLEQQKDRKQEVLNSICNSVIRNLTQCDTSHLSWHYDPSTVTCFSDDYVLDFLDGSIRHGKAGYPLIYPFKREREEQRHKEFGIKPNELWWKARGETQHVDDVLNLRISFDGSTILVLPIDTHPYLLKDNGIISSTRLALFGNEEYEKLPFLKAFSFIHYFIEEAGTKNDYILSCFKDGQKPFMRIDFSPEGISSTRVDETGKALPYRLANLEQLAHTNPLYACTLRFAYHDKILCFIHETTQEIEELHFSNLNLSFKREGKGLESNEFPGYYLAPLDVKALKTYSRDAMVLRNAEGKIKVILPLPKIEKKKLGFSEKKKKKIFGGGAPKYFIFDLDSADAPLTCKNVSESLFLIYFLKCMGTRLQR